MPKEPSLRKDGDSWAEPERLVKPYREVPVADWDIENKAGVVATIAELGIGLWLILGAKGIVEMLFRFRNLGVRERDPGDQAGGS